ncbi:hypothetical protein CBL_04981 [Carabus blaptoides fortunei]
MINSKINYVVLQATPGAYDIKEKIREANDELFEDFGSYNNATREQRVTFKEDLVDYEPDYSSDDGYVQSPDALSLSANENDDHVYEHIGHHSLESISEMPTQGSLEIDDANEKYDTDSGKCEINNKSEKCEIDNSQNNVNEESQGQVEQKIEKFDAIEVEEENIVEEEILTDNSEQSDQSKTECDDKSNEEDITGEDEILDEDKSIEVIEIINDTDDDVEDDISETLSTINDEEDNTKDVLDKCKTSTSKRCSSKIDKVNCRIHCLEKKDLDKITGGSKSLVDISKGPILKLRPRPCCTNRNAKPRLPVYNGLISEYGLTKAQLERRKRQQEKSLQRKREKSNRINEEKRQKEMFNEEIFCAWLKSVRQRSGNSCKENRNIQHGTSQMRLRPSTCNVASCAKKEQVRRRPSTSPAKSCITILVTPTMTIKEVIMYKKKRI